MASNGSQPFSGFPDLLKLQRPVREEKPIDVRVVQHFDVDKKEDAWGVALAHGVMMPFLYALAYRAFVRRFTRDVIGTEVTISRKSAYLQLSAAGAIAHSLRATPLSKNTVNGVNRYLAESVAGVIDKFNRA